MTALGRRTLLWMIPINLLLIVWVWFGRLSVGVVGWFVVIFAFTLVPVLLIGLLITTILAFTQPGRPRHLTGPQRSAQWTTWAGMFAFGLFCPDFGDAPDSELSLLTNIFGPSRTLLDVSYYGSIALAGITVVAWLVLLVNLTGGRRTA